MNDRAPSLTPYPLPMLLGRISREWSSRGRIFDLPTAKFYRRPADCDLSLEVSGRRIATPIGPAAGPHTQLAQNIVLAWLAGARAFELKTVQIQDELLIGRPCIDVETVGFNIEWSQELSLDLSLTEYVKSAVLLEVLRQWEPLRVELGDPGGHVFELSVGYDLEGVSSPRIKNFIDLLRRADPLIEEQRCLLDGQFAFGRDLQLPSRIIGGITLSTFHGCPPDQIEAIVRHLMTDHDMDVTVKLNPTLLGLDRTQAILHDLLGYTDLQLVPEAFAEDLSLERAVAMIESLDQFARERNRVFGIKLTNTLVVENHKGRLPGQRMYLSGAPLHLLAIAVLDRLVNAMPWVLKLGPLAGTVPVAFSAGIDKENFARTVALGLAPVTVCTDLLRPGGYARLGPMLVELAKAMAADGCQDLPSWQLQQNSAAKSAGRRDLIEETATSLLAGAREGPYASVRNAKPLHQVDQKLQMWDCTSCNFCVTVCPNNAFLRLPTPSAFKRELKQRWQYFNLAEVCNDCGNCATFCPEQGDPAQIKPRLFVDPQRFDREGGPAFLVTRGPEGSDKAFAVSASWHVADQTGRVAEFMNDPKGLPLRPEDLTPARATGRRLAGRRRSAGKGDDDEGQ